MLFPSNDGSGKTVANFWSAGCSTCLSCFLHQAYYITRSMRSPPPAHQFLILCTVSKEMLRLLLKCLRLRALHLASPQSISCKKKKEEERKEDLSKLGAFGHIWCHLMYLMLIFSKLAFLKQVCQYDQEKHFTCLRRGGEEGDRANQPLWEGRVKTLLDFKLPLRRQKEEIKDKAKKCLDFSLIN